MALDIFRERGVPLEKQQFTWRDMVQAPTSRLDAAAFTRVRVILMNGLEIEANRFSHACARMNRDLQLPLARVRRVEQHQAAMVNWLLPAERPEPIEYKSHREFVRETLAAEVDLRASGTQFVSKGEEPERSLAYREQLNSEGSLTFIPAAARPQD